MTNFSLPPSGQITNAQGLVLAYRVWPCPAAKGAIFIVHGVCEHSARYETFAQYLNSIGYDVFAMDHHGHGLSQGERAHCNNFSDYATDLEQFIAEMTKQYPAIANVPRFLLGHSAGALIAAQTALRPAFDSLKIRGMVLLSTRMTPEKGAITSSLKAKAAKDPLSLMPQKNATIKVPLTHDSSNDQSYAADPYVYHDSLRTGYTYECLMAMQDMTTRAKSFNVPMLVCHGTANGISFLETAKEWFKAAGSADKTFVDINGAYHELHNESEPYASHLKRTITKWLAERDNVVTSSRGIGLMTGGGERPLSPVYMPIEPTTASAEPPMPMYDPMMGGMPMGGMPMGGMMPTPYAGYGY